MSPPTMLVSWEPAWCEAGLSDPAVHLLLRVPRAQVEAALPAELLREVPGAGPDLLRLDPSIGMDLCAALLEEAGWRVETIVPEGALQAWPAATGR